MQKYRTKLVVIEALQLKWNTIAEMNDFLDGVADVIYLDEDDQPAFNQTSRIGVILSGSKVAHERDWIMKGPTGQWGICSDTYFQSTFERVNEHKTEQMRSSKRSFIVIKYLDEQLMNAGEIPGPRQISRDTGVSLGTASQARRLWMEANEYTDRRGQQNAASGSASLKGFPHGDEVVS